MTAISPSLRAFAEEPALTLGPAPPPTRRLLSPRYALELSPTPSQSVTCCVRATEATLDATIADVRREVRGYGYTGNVWQVGPSCAPAGLSRLLRERGFQTVNRPPFEATSTVMALGAAPPPVSTPGIEARLCANLDEFVEALRVALDAFNEPEEAAEGWLAAAPSLWASQDAVRLFTHIAFLDGRPVGMGFSCASPDGVFLNGSGVRATARGRGVYRALLAARYEYAQKIGRPGLAIHAGAMSRPILERCGFEALCQLEFLEDTGFPNE